MNPFHHGHMTWWKVHGLWFPENLIWTFQPCDLLAVTSEKGQVFWTSFPIYKMGRRVTVAVWNAFLRIITFNPTHDPKKWLLSLFYIHEWENWGSGSLSDLLQITQLLPGSWDSHPGKPMPLHYSLELTFHVYGMKNNFVKHLAQCQKCSRSQCCLINWWWRVQYRLAKLWTEQKS